MVCPLDFYWEKKIRFDTILTFFHLMYISFDSQALECDKWTSFNNFQRRAPCSFFFFFYKALPILLISYNSFYIDTVLSCPTLVILNYESD